MKFYGSQRNPQVSWWLLRKPEDSSKIVSVSNCPTSRSPNDFARDREDFFRSPKDVIKGFDALLRDKMRMAKIIDGTPCDTNGNQSVRGRVNCTRSECGSFFTY